jgi:hypothetical protein
MTCRWPTRDEYSDKKLRLGTTLSPASSPSPSSATLGITWLRCSIDHSLSASIERNAWLAGIMLDPGSRAALAS